VLPAEVARHRFTVEEYHKMAEVGLLSEDDLVELIEGEIIEMAPIGSRHHACVMRLDELLRLPGVSGGYIVSVQGPVRLDDGNEVQPDLALLRRRPDFYARELPEPENVLLVIEVSDTTLSYDRDVKLPRYPQAGVPEVWIVDLMERRVEVYWAPSAEGYRLSRKFGPGEQARSVSLEGLSLPIDKILG
jgi:Uma2 family endonuclease